ncbi:MAG TPA: helix-turn-helix domain-containing protein [Trebonia sp.]|jgi:AcrR family transcriptional regulator|nr:helix-turn-helix domain-containing protein [Trebonia sp.]
MAQAEAGGAGARARQRMETHERVFRAAIRVLTARGYDGATMEEVAAEAGVARRTAFYHFPAKSDIATEWATRRGEQAFEVVRQSGDPARWGPDRVRAYFHELAVMTERDWEETRQLTTGWLRAQGTPGHRPVLSSELRDWLDGWLRSPPGGTGPAERVRDPALAAEVLFDVFRGALLRWIPERDPERGRFTAEADAAVLLVLAGLGYRPESQS